MSRAKLLKGKIFFHGHLYSAGDILPDTPETLRLVREDRAALIEIEQDAKANPNSNPNPNPKENLKENLKADSNSDSISTKPKASKKK